MKRILCLVLLLGLSSPLLAEPQVRPNVLLILVDDMGFSDLGCYGGEIATPQLDKLAKNGLRFSQFYNTARCWPTRGAILTGYYAQQIRRDTLPGLKSGNQGVRPAWAPLLPEYLRPLGYRSYHSGKWQIDGKPLANGFDRSYSLEDHDRHFAPRRHTEDDRPLPAVDATAGYYSSTAIADHAIRCLKEHAATRAKQPFFSYVAFTAPHFPLHAPAEDIARYRKTYLAGWDVLREQRWRRLQALGIGGKTLSEVERQLGPPYAFPDAMKKLGPAEVNLPLAWKDLGEQQQRFQAEKMAVHAAMIDRMDREVGRLVEQLQAMKALENTLIFFLSDNGATAEIMVRGDGHDPAAAAGSGASFLCLGPGWSSLCNTPFRRHKSWVHEGGICTPLIVHWPQGFSARGEWRHSPGHVIDIFATVVDVAGAKLPQRYKDQPVPLSPSRSLLPLLNRDQPLDRPLLWWLHEGHRAVRVGDWKLVAARETPWELYNLREDRAETKDLAQQHPDKVRELAELWTKQFDQARALAEKDLPPQAKSWPKKK